MIVVKQRIDDYTSINIKVTNGDYDENTNYMFGDIKFYNHYYYRSVIDNNKGNTPSENPNSWLRWSISNRYAQADLRSLTKTIYDQNSAIDWNVKKLITVIPNDSYDIISFGRLIGKTLTVEVLNASGTVVDTHHAITYPRPNSNTWYNYYFDQFLTAFTPLNYFFRIKPIQGGTIRITVTIDDSLQRAEVGYMVAGKGVHLGDTLYGVSLGLNDNSLVEIDDYGITTVTKRDANQTQDVDVVFPSSHIQEMKRRVRDIYGRIVLFIADETSNNAYEHLPILGYVEDFTTVLNNSVETKASLSIKEVI